MSQGNPHLFLLFYFDFLKLSLVEIRQYTEKGADLPFAEIEILEPEKSLTKIEISNQTERIINKIVVVFKCFSLFNILNFEIN